jgi:hypothetical protein
MLVLHFAGHTPGMHQTGLKPSALLRLPRPIWPYVICFVPPFWKPAK